ncbi:hypothetical protein VSX64_08040 [Aurantimonas sp. C2-6-R+9]|uniref:hypothetical protein n=1 Tax=unclassified Aurantimonas TaxID=2638230 RepID=UPI002E186431|nr:MULTISPECIES: hypothetical protein [unclassified Aurantimonas]MEC5289477.1 hypothetical protein [Aurantimonas sp. C2-3-R2]MEC5380834.1 hypothetical protein [Aurantimonas sp. C2-6-R+9]MEC5410558.1 hypothetical protein [Aurantimonas sp. C2-4-R8]
MTTSSTKIVNTPWMRLVALLLAVLLAIGAYFLWLNTEGWVSTVGERAERLQKLTVSDEVAACIDKRSADIDAMVEQGMISADAAEQSRSQARSLCYDRN